MPDNGEQWLSERCEEAGLAVSWRITGHLHHEDTAYQSIDIYQTAEFGRLMTIDNLVMLTSRDNFLYHEMLAHPALYSHPAPRRVLIVGGGDCGTLREVLRHPEVERVTQVEIDERVTRLAEIHFPELCEANDDPRAELRFEDAIGYMANAEAGSADIILVDSTDPYGPAEGLFGPEFVADCQRVLGNDGIMAQQSESPLIHAELIAGIRANMQGAGLSAMRTLGFPQPCYPSGYWSVTLARKGARPLHQFRDHAGAFATRYYTPAIHRGALSEPPFLQQACARYY